MYQTLTRGFGLMAPQTWMVPQQKYDVIHYIREAYLKPHNPAQYATRRRDVPRRPAEGRRRRGPAAVDDRAVGDDGLRPEPDGDLRGRRARAEHRVQGDRRPARRRARRRVARAGPGRVRPRHAAVRRGLDRRRASSTGTGINFNGQHQVHPQLVGSVAFANPVGPGWADPATGRFDDPRLRGPRRPALRPAAAGLGAVQGTVPLRRPDRSSRTPSATPTSWRRPVEMTRTATAHAGPSSRARTTGQSGRSPSYDLLLRDRRGRAAVAARLGGLLAGVVAELRRLRVARVTAAAIAAAIPVDRRHRCTLSVVRLLATADATSAGRVVGGPRPI